MSFSSGPFDQGRDHSRRELAGYGPNPPDPKWPGGAKVALSFVLNVEEGGEHIAGGSSQNNLNDDEHAEMFLTEGGAASTVPGAAVRRGRNLNVESSYEYGSRRGFHRILDLFKRHNLRFTSWAVGRAVELTPQLVPLMEEAGCEVASHSYRWIDYADMSEEEEKEHVRRAIRAIEAASARSNKPRGWYTGRQSIRTRRIVYEVYRELDMLDRYYDSDAYDEDLPYYIKSPLIAPEDNGQQQSEHSPPILVVPYHLSCNDMKFGVAPGFATASDFSTYLKDALDVLIAEGQRGSPKMMSVGLHCRIIGQPGRFKGLSDFVEYVKEREKAGDIWVATRGEIADHWRKTHPTTSS